MEKKSIGVFLTSLRKAEGMTQKQLAEKLNVSDKAVSRWERDESSPDISLILEISEIFGVTADEILRGEKNNNTSNSKGGTITPREQKLTSNRIKRKSDIYNLICGASGLLGFLIMIIFNMVGYCGFGFMVATILYIATAICTVIFTNSVIDYADGTAIDDEDKNNLKERQILISGAVASEILGFFIISIPYLDACIHARDAVMSLVFHSFKDYLSCNSIYITVAIILAAITFFGIYIFAVNKKLFVPTKRTEKINRITKRISPLIIKISVALLVVFGITYKIQDWFSCGHNIENLGDFGEIIYLLMFLLYPLEVVDAAIVYKKLKKSDDAR